VIQQRAEKRDYLDLMQLIKAGVPLSEALGSARALYGEVFNPMVSLKALAYFEDGNLPSLPAEIKAFLRMEAQKTRAMTQVLRKSNELT